MIEMDFEIARIESLILSYSCADSSRFIVSRNDPMNIVGEIHSLDTNEFRKFPRRKGRNYLEGINKRKKRERIERGKRDKR